jgi:hypothetical protein
MVKKTIKNGLRPKQQHPKLSYFHMANNNGKKKNLKWVL